MTIVTEYDDYQSCERAGFYWYEGACHTDTYAVEKGLLGDWFNDTAEEVSRIVDSFRIVKKGTEPFYHWTNLANEAPPNGTMQRFFWQAGILFQMLISVLTFPAGLACFLLEESVQAESMGAFMLSSSKMYEPLIDYSDQMINNINQIDSGLNGLAIFSPLIGAGAIRYMQAARKTARVFKKTAEYNLAKEEQSLEAEMRKYFEGNITMNLRLESAPASAEIWIDGSNTGLLTPETLTFNTEGSRTITLRKYDRQAEGWRIYSFTQEYRPGRRVEKMINLPTDIEGEGTEGDTSEETITKTVPEFVNSEVMGDYAVDGDTFVTVNGDRIRIIGIDAPELGRPFGDESKAFLQKAIEDKSLTLKIQSHKVMDVYDRILAEVRNYKGNVAVSLLSEGYAKQLWGDDDYFDTSRYTAAENVAKELKKGIWTSL